MDASATDIRWCARAPPIIGTGDEEEYVAVFKAIREKDRAAANGARVPIGSIGSLVADH